jgi:hypothetical protein
MLSEKVFKITFLQVIRSIYMDEGKRLISYFSHSELLTIGTTAEMEKKVRRYLKPTNDSWRVDETYIKVKGEYKYLYRAVDSDGNTIDFMLRARS